MRRALAAMSLSMAIALVACGKDDPSTFAEGDAGASVPAADGSADPGPGFGSGIDSGPPTETGRSTPVDVVFTADNAYKFGWGSKTAVSSLQGKPANNGAKDIFECPVGQGPEAYEVPAEQAPVDGYLYVIAWDDRSFTQGALGQFKRRETDKVVYSGDAAWEVCATGLRYDATSSNAVGPTIEIVNEELARCTAGTGDKTKSSGGWVNAAGAVTDGAVGALMVGEDNAKGYEDGVFPITCQKDPTGKGIDAAARWMWYSSDKKPHFKDDPDPRAFLIFRLPNAAVPPPPVN